MRRAGEGHRGLLDGPDAAFLLPLRRVGFDPSCGRARGDFMSADNLGDFDVLARAERGCGSVRELLEDLLGGEVSAAIKQLLVV